LAAFMDWLEKTQDRRMDSYEDLWKWSVEDLDQFWMSIWRFFDVQADGSPVPVLARRSMPGAEWFPNTRLNYAEHVFRNATVDRPALLARSEHQPLQAVAWAELQATAGSLAATLRNMGVGPGDRVVSYMPNLPQTVIAFLACASIGAIWSSC